MRRLVVLLIVAGCATPEDPGPCMTDEVYFRDRVQAQVLTPVCAPCHRAGGEAGDSDLLLASSSEPNWLSRNRAALAELATLERAGEPVLLRKPRGLDGHGGGAVLDADSDELAVLRGFLERLDAPVLACDEVTEEGGLLLADPQATLRKAALRLVGRLPTAGELDAVDEASLGDAVDALLDEPAFGERMVEIWNDVLLTDRYLSGSTALALLDADRYPQRYWWEGWEGAERNARRDCSNDAIAREPLALLARIVAEDRPFTDLVTADTTVVNECSAYVYGLRASAPDPDDPDTWALREARLDTPSAGVLTTAAFLGRYPSTPTNRNRHRARVVLDRFLATDILATADRPVNSDSSVHNPTLNDPACTVCHATLDPIAGTFQNRSDSGRYEPPEDGWYAEMAPPGLDGADLPAARRDEALAWLGAGIAQDPRFPLAVARTLFVGLTGQPLLRDDPDDAVGHDAWLLQEAFLDTLATEMVDAGFDLKAGVRALVLSRWFRAVGDDGASEATLRTAGTFAWATPEELDRRIEAIVGRPWASTSTGARYLQTTWRLLYGGIDSDGTTRRLRTPNGVFDGIARRMAMDVACLTTARELAWPAADRRLLPRIEAGWTPQTPEGFDVPEVEAAIRDQLVFLFQQVLGERHTPDDVEIEAAYSLWHDAWTATRDAVQDGSLGEWLPGRCRGTTAPDGATLPDADRLNRDPDGTVRAWMAVLAYVLDDPRLLVD